MKGTKDLVFLFLTLGVGMHFLIKGLVIPKTILWKTVSYKKSALLAKGSQHIFYSNLTWDVKGNAPLHNLAALY